MLETELFNKAEEIIKKIINIMDEIYIDFSSKSQYKKQLLRDLKTGYVIVKGLYRPFTSISHKILFEEYRMVHFQGFLNFYKNIFSNIDNYFTEFSYRTLIDIGVEITQIIFSEDIEKGEKERFILNILLTDYGILAFNNPIYLKDFENLLIEKADLLNNVEKSNFNEMLNSIKMKNIDELNNFLEKAMKSNSKTQFNLFQNTNTADFLSINKIKNLHSWFSHLLHGDIFLINSIFKEYKNPYQHKLRARYLLLFIGCNFLYQIKNQTNINDLKNSINKVIEDFKNIETDIKKFWNKYLKLR